MLDNECDKFYMVANAESQAGIPVCFLTSPPKGIHTTEADAEQEAVRLSQKTKQRFFILESTAFVEIVDGSPLWVNV